MSALWLLGILATPSLGLHQLPINFSFRKCLTPDAKNHPLDQLHSRAPAGQNEPSLATELELFWFLVPETKIAQWLSINYSKLFLQVGFTLGAERSFAIVIYSKGGRMGRPSQFIIQPVALLNGRFYQLVTQFTPLPSQ